MVGRVVKQLLDCPEVSLILVTLNIPEVLGLPEDQRIRVLHNVSPRGFAANHNAAFNESREEYFCPLNPDIKILGNPFTALLATMLEAGVAMAAPRVDSPAGLQEDSWRRFPTVFSLIRKILGIGNGSYLVPPDGRIFSPEWVAGMCMLFRSADYRALGGFDEGFFLYYEDVDICVRLWRSGRRLVVCPDVTVIHDARRDSHRNFRHLRWHLASITRYFRKYWGRLPSVSR
ncbi:glycosyltransferase [Ferribacterium limneticum]|uniref:glycosyltransferase n=1 Tax=Ferribacterium limneticum TaxID=76259 RepID=UPI001CF8DF32|nr:glycosyltransferase [Ferribacterium limneticum]UCV24221.1 glycosyltransferase [Ferribacterium limneticum]